MVPTILIPNKNLDYVGQIPDVTYYGANKRSEGAGENISPGTKEICVPGVRRTGALGKLQSTLRHGLKNMCRVFRREFMQIGNCEFFLEAIIIASACNNNLRIRFLEPDTTGLIPNGGYKGNVKHIQ